jgi:hypothetical protein
MTIADAVREAVAVLPVDRQQVVLEYVKSLSQPASAPIPRLDLKGIFAGKIPDLSLEDFQALRHEISIDFPRDIEE